MSLAAGLLAAGHETTVTQIPNFVYVLLTNPGGAGTVAGRAGPDAAAVEELMRWVPLGAASAFARYALEDVEIGGVMVRAGEPVLVAVPRPTGTTRSSPTRTGWTSTGRRTRTSASATAYTTHRRPTGPDGTAGGPGRAGAATRTAVGRARERADLEERDAGPGAARAAGGMVSRGTWRVEWTPPLHRLGDLREYRPGPLLPGRRAVPPVAELIDPADSVPDAAESCPMEAIVVPTRRTTADRPGTVTGRWPAPAGYPEPATAPAQPWSSCSSAMVVGRPLSASLIRSTRPVPGLKSRFAGGWSGSAGMRAGRQMPLRRLHPVGQLDQFLVGHRAQPGEELRLLLLHVVPDALRQVGDQRREADVGRLQWLQLLQRPLGGRHARRSRVRRAARRRATPGGRSGKTNISSATVCRTNSAISTSASRRRCSAVPCPVSSSTKIASISWWSAVRMSTTS